MKNAFYESRYGKIHYNLIGSDELPYLVFIHGVGMDHKTYDVYAEAYSFKNIL